MTNEYPSNVIEFPSQNDETVEQGTSEALTFAEVGMSEQGQRELVEIVGFMVEDLENPELSDKGATILGTCLSMYKDGIRFDIIKQFAKDAVAPFRPDYQIPDIYR